MQVNVMTTIGRVNCGYFRFDRCKWTNGGGIETEEEETTNEGEKEGNIDEGKEEEVEGNAGDGVVVYGWMDAIEEGEVRPFMVDDLDDRPRVEPIEWSELGWCDERW